MAEIPRLQRLAEIALELGDRVTEAEATSEETRLAGERFFVACLGQFKRGKSTLLNALLGVDVLPAGVVPVTSVVTMLIHGPRPAATVHFRDGRRTQIALDRVAEFVDERVNPGNRRQAAVVEIALPTPMLRDGGCLVDTPGLGSADVTNTAATRAFIPRVDVALLVVGPDPPISGAEVELIRALDRRCEVVVALNKADLVRSEQLPEILAFTRTTIAAAHERVVDRVFTVSARERIEHGRPTRDWEALERHLAQLGASSRTALVETARRRAIRRIARQLDADAGRQVEALTKPIQEIEARVMRLRDVFGDVERSLADLRFLCESVEADAGRRFEAFRVRFMSEIRPSLVQRLNAWIATSSLRGRQLRKAAFEEAHRVALTAIESWLPSIEPAAEELYRSSVERLIETANDYIARIHVDVSALDVYSLPSEAGFRIDRQFHFTSLTSATAGGPAPWSIDLFAPPLVQQASVRRAAVVYLAHLLDSNSYRVENDLKERTRESRRWLERQIRNRLNAALESAERGVRVAEAKRTLSQVQIDERLIRLCGLRRELAGCSSAA